jgi:hypothetical protein
MKINLKNHKSIHFLTILFSFLLFFLQQNSGYSQCASINCDGTTASGLYSSAIGRYTSAPGNYSFAGGFYSVAEGSTSIAFGNRASTNGSSSIALGQFINVTASTAIGIGNGYDINNPLVNNTARSLMIGIGSTKPTFFVGQSYGIEKTGRIGIGNVTSPQAKLHIRADELEDASLLLEASAGGQAKVILSEWHEIAYETDENLHLRTAQSKAFVFHRGDIFIEDIQSGIIMRSPNGQCWRGRVNDQGMLAFEQTECPTAETALPEHGQEKHLMRVFPNPASKHLEVVADGLNGSYTLRLLTATGQLMLEQQSRATHTQLNIQNLPSGTYLLVLEQDGQMKDSVKVLVE